MNKAWNIVENTNRKNDFPKMESLFSLGNGYLGFRGNMEEVSSEYYRGVFLNGFYETQDFQYGEKAYGFPDIQQSMLNLPDGRITEFYLNKEKLDLKSKYLKHHHRELNIKTGILSRKMLFEIDENYIQIEYKTIVSATIKELALQTITLKSEKPISNLTIHSRFIFSSYDSSSENDPRTRAVFRHKPLVTGEILKEENSLMFNCSTVNSKLQCYCGYLHSISCDSDYSEQFLDNKKTASKREEFQFVYSFNSDKSFTELKFDKYIFYSQKMNVNINSALDSLKDYYNIGSEKIMLEHIEFWSKFWQKADILIKGDDEALLVLRFNMFQLMQSAGRDGKTSIAAKGLTGAGYDGHYFWDTEIYMQPFFTYTMPEIACSLINYRASCLPKARKRAEVLNQKGALYPWRTINGDESSAYFPAGTAQYHINTAISYAIFRYLRVSGETGILFNKQNPVLEMLLEIARFWFDLGFFNKQKDGAFCIHEVTGPDEYSALVNNNFYTNIQAAYHLENTAALINQLKCSHLQELNAALTKLKISDIDITNWQKAADLMYVPYDQKLAVFAQDESFLNNEVWDFDNTPEDKYPLLLHYHPLVIYRYQVLKQADAILAFVMQPGKFSTADKLRTFQYYEPLTTGDSSLSSCIQGLVAAQLDLPKLAFSYFEKTAFLDFHDLHGNVKDGLHLAASGGIWVMTVFGFGGLDDTGEYLSFSPKLPEKWELLQFNLLYKGGTLQVKLEQQQAGYLWIADTSIIIEHEYQKLELAPDREVLISLKPELKAVLFDLDGVITDTSDLHFRAWKQLADEFNIPFNSRINRLLKGISRLESMEIILKHANIKKNSKEIADLAAIKNNYYQKMIKKISAENLLPGIKQLLIDCRAHNVRCALTSASKNALFVLEQLQITEYFDVIVNPEKLKKGKPDPEIFLKAAEELEIMPRDCIGIEDAKAGVCAINRAKIISVGIGEDGKDADFVLKDTSELNLELLRKMF